MAKRKAAQHGSRTRRAAPSAPAARPASAAERVVAELAHDIRTPLTGILALAELLAASELGEREREWVAALKNSAEHLSALTTLIVDAAKNARDIAVRQQPFDPRALAQAVAAGMAARAQGAGLAFKASIARNLPALVIGDEVRLRAALENLADNAVKFTERGAVGLAVGAETRARGVRLTFAVSDSGIGLTPAEIRRLFRPFAQAHAGIARRFGGAGLGLSLVKRMAQAMGGSLTVTSRPGAGSTFTLAVTVKPVPGQGARRRRGRALHILCVEDNPFGRVVMNTILTGLGHSADFVAGGERALAALARRRYDLVLLDVTLAGMSGIETARRIRASTRGARIPIVGMSGHGDAAAAARKAGMDAFLVKPVSPRALAETIADVTRAAS